VPPAQKLQSLRVEGLNPEREEPDIEIAPGANALEIDVLRIRLEGNPGVFLDRKVFADGPKDARDVVRSQRRGGAAAEVDRVDPLEG
jgi:hypothetical protein